MAKPTNLGGPKAEAGASKARAFHLVYDQAVRATLEGGRRQEIADLLSAAKRLKTQYRDFDGLIATLETAARKAR